MNLRIFLLVVLSLAVVLGQRREEQIRRQQIRRQEIRQGQIIRQRQTSHGQTSHGQTQIRQSSSHGQTSQGQTRVRQSQSRQSQSGGRLGQGSTTRRRIITESQRRITQSQSRDRVGHIYCRYIVGGKFNIKKVSKPKGKDEHSKYLNSVPTQERCQYVVI